MRKIIHPTSTRRSAIKRAPKPVSGCSLSLLAILVPLGLLAHHLLT
jgi:hypothetical protein